MRIAIKMKSSTRATAITIKGSIFDYQIIHMVMYAVFSAVIMNYVGVLIGHLAATAINALVEFCSGARSREEMMAFMELETGRIPGSRI